MAYTRLPFFYFKQQTTGLRSKAHRTFITSAIIPCREKRHENIAVSVSFNCLPSYFVLVPIFHLSPLQSNRQFRLDIWLLLLHLAFLFS